MSPRRYSKPQTLKLWSYYRLEDLGTFFRVPKEHLAKIEASLKVVEKGWPALPYEQYGEVILIQFFTFRKLYDGLKRAGEFKDTPYEAEGVE